MASEDSRVLADFTAASRRLLDSDFDDARDNIIRLLAIIRGSRDLSHLVESAPRQPPFKKMELANNLLHNSLRLPPEPEAELGVAMQILSTIEAEGIPFTNYVWEPHRHPGDVMRKYIGPSLERLRLDLSARVAGREELESRFGRIILEDHQKELLSTMVEASRNVAEAERQPFRLAKYVNEPVSLLHAGLPAGKIGVYDVDLQMLERESLVTQVGGRGMFDVTPKGYQLYSYLRERAGQPYERMAGSVKAYLSSRGFEERHPAAHAKWLQADKKLWDTESGAQLTEIGHVCREAVQAFAGSIAARRGVSEGTKKTETIERIRKVLKTCSHLGKAERAFLDALLVYWGTVIDLVERQEHGAAKEEELLVWEDARRLVFHTAIVLYEIDKAVERSSTTLSDKHSRLIVEKVGDD